MHYALLTSAGTNKHNKVIISNALWKRIETLYRNMVCALHKQDIAKPSARKLFQQLFCCTREVSGHYAQWLPIKLIGNGWSANATKSCLLSWQSAGIEIGAGKRGNRWMSFSTGRHHDRTTVVMNSLGVGPISMKRPYLSLSLCD